MIRYSKYLIIIAILMNTAIAQKTKPDTTSINFKDTEEPNAADTSLLEIKYIPEDMIFVPSDLLYDHQWNNDQIRLRKINPSEKKDTTLIIFNNSPENNFYFPVKGKLLSPFGYRRHHFHTGVDIKLKHNDSVYAVMSGVVRIAKRFKGYGNVVLMRHYNGLETVYSHLSKICVNVDEELEGGDLVGLGGRTGRATGDHLHFETRFLEQPINPMEFLDFETYRLKADTLVITANTFNKLASPPNKPYSKGRKKKGTSKNNANKPVKPSNGVINKSTEEQAKKPASEQTSGSLQPQQQTDQKGESKVQAKKYHIVRQGDNLYNIAKRNKTTVEKLRQLNGFGKNKILKIGIKVRIR